MNDLEFELPPECVPGAIFKEVYGNRNDKLWHVRGIVDGLAVCRTWSREKARWRYSVLMPEFFLVLDQHEHIVWRKVPQTKGDAQ